MLPTKGYFQDIDCPYHNSSCGRPYCHFRHKRKPQESLDESSDVPTYKPTPKSELANSRNHIPISYVPDLAFKPDRTARINTRFIEKPVYKPTPLTLLSSETKQNAIVTDETAYAAGDEVPENSTEVVTDDCDNVSSNSDNGSKVEGKVRTHRRHEEYKPSGSVRNIEYKPGSSTEAIQNELVAYMPSGGNSTSLEYCPSQITDAYDPTAIDFEDLSNEFNMIDEIIEDGNRENSEHIISLLEDGHGKFPSTDLPLSTENQHIEAIKYCNEIRSKTDSSSKPVGRDKHRPSKDKEKTRRDSDDRSSKEKSREGDDAKVKRKSETEKKVHKQEEKSHSKNDTKEKEKRSVKSESVDKNKNIKDSSNSKLKTTSKDKNKSMSSSDGEKSKEKKKMKEPKSDQNKNKRENLERKRDKKEIKFSDSEEISSDMDNKVMKVKKSSSSRSDHRKEKFKKDELVSSKKEMKNTKNESKKEKHSDKKHTQDKNKTNTHKHDKKRDKKDSRRERKTSTSSSSSDFSENSKQKLKNKEKSSSYRKEKEVRGKYSEKEESKKRKIKDSDGREKKHSDRDRDRKHKSKYASDQSDSSEGNDNNIHEEQNLDLSSVEDTDLNFDYDEDATMMECYRIFNEYKPPEPVVEVTHNIDSLIEDQIQIDQKESLLGKKRIAHANAEAPATKPKLLPKTVPSAEHAMTNRFKIARLVQASDEQRQIMDEVKKITSLKRPTPPTTMQAIHSRKVRKTLKEPLIQHKPKPSTSTSTSLVDDIITSTAKSNNAVAKFTQRRIAPVFNVQSMQKAKERIEEMKKKICEDAVMKTTAQTQKGKRVAHVPDYSLAAIPDVLQADKSKLPVNVRTRFLTMIADECIKLYITSEDAYSRALNEEFSCYERCKVLTTYKNSAMLAVNRIRRELQERTKSGLGPIKSNEKTDKDKTSNFTGKNFYYHVRQYLLTEEDLDVHGYPRESEVPGRAFIKNRKSPNENLRDNQRKCVRCSKFYLVADDGFAFYDEECIYHPLKKRTLRGEQTYLCCKSNDDTGCVTAHSHVSESGDNFELDGFQTTMDPESEDDPRSYAVYALDCEMCYTIKGLELTRVTIVDPECKIVYESLVKPLNPIVDYNTRFSGITKDQMDRTSTSILQVQANILHLCNSKTILIGHSLESDMKALKIVHNSIVDTAVLFPHRMGLPHKRALRALASEILKKIIQNQVSGHDSAEDAVTCMELIKYKVQEELKLRGAK